MIKRENKLFDVEINKAEFVKKNKEGKTRKQRGRNGRDRERRKKEILYISTTQQHARVYAYVHVRLANTERK